MPGGAGPFCRFSVPNRWRDQPGVYVFLVDGVPTYVGECECLVRRVNQGYGRIAPRNCFLGGRATNVRVNALIRNAILHARAVDLVFVATGLRKHVEREMIGNLKPAWNRSVPREVAMAPSALAANKAILSSQSSSAAPGTNCRQAVLLAAREVVRDKGCEEFTVREIIDQLAGSDFSENTIRTHVTSRCCRNAPDNHSSTYEDFERVGRGLYKLA